MMGSACYVQMNTGLAGNQNRVLPIAPLMLFLGETEADEPDSAARDAAIDLGERLERPVLLLDFAASPGRQWAHFSAVDALLPRAAPVPPPSGQVAMHFHALRNSSLWVSTITPEHAAPDEQFWGEQVVNWPNTRRRLLELFGAIVIAVPSIMRSPPRPRPRRPGGGDHPGPARWLGRGPARRAHARPGRRGRWQVGRHRADRLRSAAAAPAPRPPAAQRTMVTRTVRLSDGTILRVAAVVEAGVVHIALDDGGGLQGFEPPVRPPASAPPAAAPPPRLRLRRQPPASNDALRSVLARLGSGRSDAPAVPDDGEPAGLRASPTLSPPPPHDQLAAAPPEPDVREQFSDVYAEPLMPEPISDLPFPDPFLPAIAPAPAAYEPIEPDKPVTPHPSPVFDGLAWGGYAPTFGPAGLCSRDRR